jgi:hypothetical protein
VHHISDDLLSALVDEPSYQITWTWDHIDGYYEKLWPEHWGTGSLRTGAAIVALHVKPDKMPELERETFTA